jgi:hypothetical protein
MGENVRKGQVESFQKGSDRSLKDLATPTLFDRPDIVSTVFTASTVEGQSVIEGEWLEGHAAADGCCIRLVRGHVSVGCIEGDGGKVLIDALREPGSPGVVPMQVTSVSAVSGFFKAILANEKGIQ